MKKLYAYLFIATLSIFLVNVGLFNVVHAQESVDFEILRVVWGDPQNNPIIVNPGDTNVPLTIYVKNNSSKSLVGVYGELSVTEPFKHTENNNYTARTYATPIESSNVLAPTGEVLPWGTFTLTYHLNINNTAKKGTYTCTLTIYYTVNSSGTYTSGIPKTYSVAIIIYNRPPSIESYRPSDLNIVVYVNDSIDFFVKCSDPDNDTLSYEWTLDGETVATTNNYTYTPTEEDVGTHNLEFAVDDGELRTTMTWTLTVNEVITTRVNVSSNYLFGGFETRINITVQNNAWDGTVQISFGIQSPLVIHGNSSWTFRSVVPDQELNVSVVVYAPQAAIGNTFTGTLTISYDDEYGNSYTENHNIGFVVRGHVSLVAYDWTIMPNPASQGGKVSISATLLNKGTATAMFVNVSIRPNEILVLTQESSSYIGDVEENSPVPFTVAAYVKSDVQNGTYPVTITVTYTDDLFEEHTFNITVYVRVQKSSSEESESEEKVSFIDLLYQGGLTILISAVALIAIVVLFLRKSAKPPSSSFLFVKHSLGGCVEY